LPVYTFYCCRPDGAAPSFEMFELASDEAAAERAAQLLATHPSASHIAVCDGDREVLVERRSSVSDRSAREPQAADQHA
jgi:hypothetical protein